MPRARVRPSVSARLANAGTLAAILRRVGQAALTVVTCGTATGCCMPYFEEFSEGLAWSRAVPMPAQLARQAPRPDAALPEAVCRSLCGSPLCFPAVLQGDSGVESEVVVCNNWVEGSCSDTGVFRMPSGRRAALLPRAGDLAAALDALADAEAASVGDFVELAGDLARAGAPRTLVRRARAAAQDEMAHARAMRGLARRAGARRGRPRVASRHDRAAPVHARRCRSLAALALENAVVGCVGETLGALLALHQAEHAPDAETRRVLGTIARDETRHAALALAVHTWLLPRLSVGERERVVTAARRALAALAASPPPAAASPIVVALGLPPPRLHAALTRVLAQALAPGLVGAG